MRDLPSIIHHLTHTGRVTRARSAQNRTPCQCNNVEECWQELQAALVPLDPPRSWIWSLLPFLAMLALLVLFAALAMGAPVPKAKPAPGPLEIGKGNWVLVWSGMAEDMPLTAAGGYCWGESWTGSYGWSSKSRILIVNETNKDGSFITWHAVLDANGKGEVASGEFKGVTIQVRRKPPK